MTGTRSVTDVRIIVEGLSDVIKVSEALRHASLGGDYGATVTAIIPTTNPDIARNAAFGADIVIVALPDHLHKDAVIKAAAADCLRNSRLPMVFIFISLYSLLIYGKKF